MPAPGPFGIEIGYGWPSYIRVLAHSSDATILGGGNRCHRINRAKAILKALARDGWCCPWCCGPVPLFRRADAVFCSEGCRKPMARQGLKGQSGSQWQLV